MRIAEVVVSCEHSTNRVPPRYAVLFAGEQEILSTHRGIDIGALRVASHLADALGAPLLHGKVTRLLVELNRSLRSKELFSRFSRPLPQAEKQELLDRYWRPYREAVLTELRKGMAGGRTVLHLSVHSFTPELDGHVRNCDVGLMYDPRVSREKAFSATWRDAFERLAPWVRVRMNYPYRGISDGIVRGMKRALASTRGYLPAELEMNQKHLAAPGPARDRLRDAVLETLREALRRHGHGGGASRATTT